MRDVMMVLVNVVLIVLLLLMAKRINYFISRRKGFSKITLWPIRLIVIAMLWLAILFLVALYITYVGRGRSFLFVAVHFVSYVWSAMEVWFFKRIS